MDRKQFNALTKRGVTIYGYTTVFIDKDSEIESGVIIYPNNHIEGSIIKQNATLMPGNIIIDSQIGSSTLTTSVVVKSTIADKCNIGPFSYLRPGSNIQKGAKIADFVEIKNSSIGENTKVSHLAYVGDSSIGKNCNIGCGVIFVNYNGKIKQKTRVGDNCFIGSNCNLIAPLTIGDDAYIAAGTTITEDVQKGSFVIGRAVAVEKKDRSHKYIAEHTND